MTTKIHPDIFPGLRKNIFMLMSDDKVIDTICETFDIYKILLLSKRRTDEYAKVRIMLYNIFKTEKSYGSAKTGRILIRNHSSVIKGLVAHNELMEYDEIYKHNYNGFIDFVLYNKTFEVLKHPKKTFAEINHYHCEDYSKVRKRIK